MKIYILAVFILTYVFIVAMPNRKPLITGISAFLVAVGSLFFVDGYGFLDILQSIDYNVVLVLLGMMITVGLFTDSGMPNKLADGIVSKIPNALFALVLLAVLSGIISAFIDNVATVLMLAPIGLAVAKKVGVNPIPVMISIAVSSNLQGASTLVGDTTSIMLASSKYANMGFLEFFFLNGKFSIFWAVEIGAALTIPILILIFRKSNKKMEYISDKVTVSSVVPTILLLLNIATLIVASFIPDKPDITNGLICAFYALVGIIFYLAKYKSKTFKIVADSIDYQTVLFLVFLFIIIACVERVGIIADIGTFFEGIGSKNIFLLYTILVFGSVLLSAFIDNIPYVATMLPVIASITSGGALADYSYLLYFGLLLGATLGGNITPFGASANVVGIGILQKEGYKVKNSDFFKIGIPFTLTAVLGGYIFNWLVWGLI